MGTFDRRRSGKLYLKDLEKEVAGRFRWLTGQCDENKRQSHFLYAQTCAAFFGWFLAYFEGTTEGMMRQDVGLLFSLLDVKMKTWYTERVIIPILTSKNA